MELAIVYLAFLPVEVAGNDVDAGWVAYQDDAVGKLFGLDVKVEYAAIFVDDKFGIFVFFHIRWYYLLSSVRRISFSSASLSAAMRSRADSVMRI